MACPPFAVCVARRLRRAASVHAGAVQHRVHGTQGRGGGLGRTRQVPQFSVLPALTERIEVRWMVMCGGA